MKITCSVEQTMPCAPRAAFDLLTDAVRFPSVFPGYGLIPAVCSVELDSPLAPGSTRRVHNSDGSILTEEITVLDAPHRHAYRLSGFSAPFSWLVKFGEADWHVVPLASGALVRWEYVFTLTGALAYPVAALVLKLFMTRAMQRCLDSMARVHAEPASATTERT